MQKKIEKLKSLPQTPEARAEVIALEEDNERLRAEVLALQKSISEQAVQSSSTNAVAGTLHTFLSS